MKCAIISPSVFCCPPTKGYGAIEWLVYDWANELARQGVQPTLIAPKGSQRPLNGELIETIEPPNQWTGREEEDAYKIYKDRLKDFEIIWDHSHQKHSYVYKTEHPETKVAGTLHGIQTFTSLPGVRYLNWCCISDWHIKDMQNRYGYTCKKVYHGVDLQHYPFNPQKEDFYLQLGLISPHKGPFLSVFLAKKFGFNLKVCGEDQFGVDANYVQYIKDECAQVKNIQYLGRIDDKVKVDLMSRAKAVLLPFLKPEAFSMIAIESLSVGSPVICMNTGAMSEIIEDGVNGFLCKALEGENSMAEAITRVDEIKPEQCRKTVETKFSMKVSTAEYIKLFKQILEGKEW